jgi:hypothetical protein
MFTPPGAPGNVASPGCVGDQQLPRPHEHRVHPGVLVVLPGEDQEAGPPDGMGTTASRHTPNGIPGRRANGAAGRERRTRPRTSGITTTTWSTTPPSTAASPRAAHSSCGLTSGTSRNGAHAHPRRTTGRPRRLTRSRWMARRGVVRHSRGGQERGRHPRAPQGLRGDQGPLHEARPGSAGQHQEDREPLHPGAGQSEREGQPRQRGWGGTLSSKQQGDHRD